MHTRQQLWRHGTQRRKLFRCKMHVPGLGAHARTRSGKSMVLEIATTMSAELPLVAHSNKL
eukprot:scaffold17053_cov78-Phaeocystis_antarctica.AAC.7